ncbi:MAG: RidA family protein [Microthrixaceae bacterium]
MSTDVARGSAALLAREQSGSAVLTVSRAGPADTINHMADVLESGVAFTCDMTNTTIQPAGVLEMEGLSQVIVSTGSRIVHISGQTPLDPAGELIGPGDLAAQARAVFESLSRCLDAAGATIHDVVKVNLFVVDYLPEHLGVLMASYAAVFGDEAPLSTSTLLGVSVLFMPGQLFEADAVAVLD